MILIVKQFLIYLTQTISNKYIKYNIYNINFNNYIFNI